jgi:hypothetical protein
MKKIFPLTLLALGLPALAFAQPVCPVCTVAVAGGVGLARWLGVSDLVSGVWVGAFLFSLVMWSLKWLNKKNIRFKFRPLIIFLAIYILTIVPLYWVHIMGQFGNTFWGMDKLLVGTMAGTLMFIAALYFENYLRKKNQGKAYFKFQKTIVPVSFLLVLSFIFYLITR